ncbi:histone acetyltransferase HAC1-like isoform X2 [Carex littledalei]|uniref:histone acetyltransferase n=1 Tax=Carex littledalei TaxID=544730 RepID=A0A833VZA4_9POAL|nr:histone acetyltransferase HAC1-like isoform X2 [Carex littledalei]
MQNHTGHVSMDPELQALRLNMQETICQLLERKHNNLSSDWQKRLPDIAKRIEESIFKKSLNKDDYMSKFQSGIEIWIKNMLNDMEQNQQRQHQFHRQQQLQRQNHQPTMAHHNIQPNSSVSGMMMIPTPGISHNPTGAMRMSSSMESNQGINPTSGPAGTMSNGYQLSHGTVSINQLGSTSMSASIGLRCQVIPMNSTSTTQVTQQTMPMNPDYNNGSGMQPQKQHQYNNLSGQVGPDMQSVPMNQKHSSQGFGDGMMNINNGIRLFGNNIQQLRNGAGMSDGSGVQPQKKQRYDTLSGQLGSGMQSVTMNQKHSSQGFGDGMMNNNNGIRLFGKNIQQLTNAIRLFGNNIQLRPTQQMQRNNHLMVADSNNSHNSHALIEKNQISQNELNQSECVRAPSPTGTTTVVRNEESSQLSQRETWYQNQLKLLLFLLHAKYCTAPDGHCHDKQCVKAKQLLEHIETCYLKQCPFRLCLSARKVLLHFRNCQELNCQVCIPARKFIITAKQKSLTLKSDSEKGLNGKEVDNKVEETEAGLAPVEVPIALPASASASLALKHSPKGMNQLDSSSGVFSDQKDADPLPKRRRMDMDMDISPVSVNNTNLSFSAMQEAFPIEQSTSNIPVKQDTRVKIDSALQNLQISSTVFDTSSVQMGCGLDAGPAGTSLLVENEERNDENATEAQEEMEEDEANKSGKPMIKAVSMIELFIPEQVREHIKSLRQCVGQSKSEAEENQAISMDENSCQLCSVEKLTFKPPPIYCIPCGVRIKRNFTYYTCGTDEHRHYICIPCFKDARGGDTIEIEGHVVPKSRLEKKKNDQVTEEEWVQCDKCEAWQHQICALFNERMNDGGQAEYTCPNCYIEEVETDERKPLPQSAMLGAKDLPRTILSDHIENRLFKRLKQERQDRANHFGKSFDEVPGAEELVVRVVSSVDKKLEVKPRFLEIFQEENYPTEFPYKSKAILLFQKIEGVEVCLLAMYVQEFGTECASPNQRHVYLSYLDSVKYFTPEIRTVSGEALRTFVYHEILLGYLEFCQRRGFTSCYIWACPPVKGDDYILYCHPKNQKTPKSGILRDWYLSMLKKGVKENIVVDLTNLYDHFFTNQGESRAKVTATRLPYFDGDFWPGAAEDMITQLHQEKNDHKLQKEKARKGLITKSALKASEHANSSSHVSKDTMLMKMLGKLLHPNKEDLILVHLQHPCNHCCTLMVSGTRWVCNSCRYFNLCESCHKVEKLREFRERHPTLSREKHTFRPVEIFGVPSDTRDKDDILESEFLATRKSFLSLCQGNHYQYDTLRRAKHSSMMVLYHLHCNDLGMGKRQTGRFRPV